MFTRAHTVILEAPISAMGAAVALGTVMDIQVLQWAAFGALYHLVGYGMNSYTDWKSGHDKNDKHKQHLPLNTGKIGPVTAKIVVYLGISMLFLYGLWLGNGSFKAFILVTGTAILGSAYNFAGKYIRYKFIPIAAAHTMLYVYPVAMLGDITSPFNILITLGLFTHHSYQIIISGDIKDIETDEASLLRQLGVQMVGDSDRVSISSRVSNLSNILTIIEVLVFLYAIRISTGVIGQRIITGAVFGLLLLIISNSLVMSGVYDRKGRIKTMSMREIVGYFIFIVAASSSFTFQAVWVILAINMVYLTIMSRFMWGSNLTPDV